MFYPLSCQKPVLDIKMPTLDFSNFSVLLKIRSERCWCHTYPARSWRLWCHLRSYSTKLVQEIQGRPHQPSRGTTPRKAIYPRPWGPLSKNWGQQSYKYIAIVTGAWSFPLDYRASSSSIRKDAQRMQRSAHDLTAKKAKERVQICKELLANPQDQRF